MISVVMPAHDEEPFLAAAVSEVVAGLRGRGGAFEIVVVENGSTDATAAVAAKLAGEYPGGSLPVTRPGRLRQRPPPGLSRGPGRGGRHLRRRLLRPGLSLPGAGSPRPAGRAVGGRGQQAGAGIGRHPGPVAAAGDGGVQHDPALRVRAQGARHPRDEGAAARRRGGPGAGVEVRHRPVRHRARHPGRAGRHAGRRAAGGGGRDPSVTVVDRPPHPPLDRGPGPAAGRVVAGGPAAPGPPPTP